MIIYLNLKPCKLGYIIGYPMPKKIMAVKKLGKRKKGHRRVETNY